MGQHDTSFGQPVIAPDDDLSYETRELAWELTQPRIDSIRVRFLIETGAHVATALHLAKLPPAALKNPQLKALQLHLHAGDTQHAPS